jgi:polyisoprenyl-teichoic acid--peptidoglycan teichoic acid transferase
MATSRPLKSERSSDQTGRPLNAGSAPARRDASAGTHPHRARRIALYVGLVVLVLLAGAAVYTSLMVHSVNKTIKPEVATQKEVAKHLTAPKPREPFTILLLGADGKGVNGDSRSDTIILGRVDTQKKRVWLISIPRDTQAEIPGYGTAKINKAWQIGGAPKTIEAVEALTGVPINHYAQVNISGFRQLVDLFGGVWVNVDVEIDDTKAAAANYKKAGSHIDPGYQRLDGNHAIVYVRSRNFVDADFTRMRHQQEFFKALAKQALSGANILKLPRTVQTLAKQIKTDMTVGDIMGIVLALRSMGDKGLETATMRGEWRSPYVYTDEEYKQHILARMRAGVSFDQTATPPGVVLPPDVSLDVRNGSGTQGVATEAAEVLRAAGFVVSEVKNAKRSDYEETLVVYSGSEDAAKAVAQALGIGKVERSNGSWSMNEPVLVVVGRDWPDRVKPAQ